MDKKIPYVELPHKHEKETEEQLVKNDRNESLEELKAEMRKK